MSSHALPTPPKDQVAEPQDVYLDRGPELPRGYASDRLGAFARDPETVWTYWTLDGARLGDLRAKHGGSVLDGARWVLRYHNWSRRETSEVAIDLAASGWYATARPNSRYIVELGAHTTAGFLSVLLSNEVHMPRNSPSDVEDPAWPITEEALEQMRRLLGTADLSAPGPHVWPSGTGVASAAVGLGGSSGALGGSSGALGGSSGAR